MYGARWNSKGTAVVYTSDSLALAILETMVHWGDVLPDAGYVAFEVSIPLDIRIRAVSEQDLPGGWDHTDASRTIARNIGDDWIRAGETVGLIVPTVIEPAGRNVLLNPAHRDFARLEIGPPQPFVFDRRLLYRLL